MLLGVRSRRLLQDFNISVSSTLALCLLRPAVFKHMFFTTVKPSLDGHSSPTLFLSSYRTSCGSSFTERASRHQPQDVYFFGRSRSAALIIRIMFHHGETES